LSEQSDHDLLVRMVERVDGMSEMMREGFDRLAKGQEDSELRIRETLNDHEGRIRKLDSRMWTLSVVAAALGAGGGFGLDRLTGG